MAKKAYQFTQDEGLSNFMKKLVAETEGDIQKKALVEVNKVVKPRMKQEQRALGIFKSISTGKDKKRSAK